MKKRELSRKNFIESTAGIIAGTMAYPYISLGNSPGSPNAIPNLAFIGIGGRGSKNIDKFSDLCNIVAFADVNEGSSGVARMRSEHPVVPFFKDYRKLIDKMHREIDAIVVSTPDHSHYAIAKWAIEAGKHVYVEKPLTHTIDEARRLKKAAADAGVVTQMGNQSFSNDGIRACKEWIDSGLIGQVQEVIQWTDRLTPGQIALPGEQWPKAEPVPEGLDWKLWLNIIQDTGYHSNIEGNWRGWWRFGSGALGDIGCHMMGIPFYALVLGIPDTVSATQRGGNKLRCPLQSEVVYEFNRSGTGAPLKMTWYDGFRRKDGKQKLYEEFDPSFLPHFPEMFPEKNHNALSDNGQFIVGDEGLIYIPAMHLGKQPLLLPEEKWEDVKNDLPEPTLERVDNHWLNFIQAIKGDIPAASSNFDVSANLTEIVLLGNLALRSGQSIKWDAENMECTGNPQATKMVKEKPANPEFLPG